MISPQEQTLGHSDVQDRARAYKSRNKRPCDFCRYKKAACHLESKPPCELCLRYGKDCTFVESPAKRRRPNLSEERLPEPILPPSTTFDLGSDLLSWEPLPSFMTASLPGGLPGEYKFDSPMFAPLMFEQFDPVQAGLAPPLTHSPHTPESTNSIPTSFFDNAQEPSLDVQGPSNAQLVGLSGEYDPYLLRRYLYDGNNECIFRTRRLRRVGENDKIPVHFLIQQNKTIAKAHPAESLSSSESFRLEIKQMISDDIGKRLIKLYVIDRLSFWAVLTDNADSSDLSNHISRYFLESAVWQTVTTIQELFRHGYLLQSMDTHCLSVFSTINSVSRSTPHHLQTHSSESPGPQCNQIITLHHYQSSKHFYSLYRGSQQTNTSPIHRSN
jgi:hypothetical protein